MAVCSWAETGLIDRAEKAETKEEFVRLLDDVERVQGASASWVSQVRNSLDQYSLETARREFISHVQADQLTAASAEEGKLADPDAEARKILSSPAYRDSGPTSSSNWLARAFESVFEAIGRWLADLLSRLRLPEMNPARPNFSAAALAVRGFMTLLGVALLAFVIYFAVKMSRGRNLRRKTGGLLDDDEPDRTADEWLQRADQLVSQGAYREAVRCLYLACLVRFDDAGVAHFDRGQTNWEHLHRITASEKKPPGLDFRPPTKSFDLFWYGYAPINADDVAEFRRLYDRLLHDLGIRAAA